MSCFNISKGIDKDCLASMGGIKNAWIMDDASVTYTIEDDVVTGIKGATNTNTFQFYFKPNTSNFTSTLNVDAANGVNYVSTEIVLQFARMEAEKRAAVAALTQSETKIVVEDSNGALWAFGVSEPVMATGGTGQTGTAKADGNYYQVTLTDNNTSFPLSAAEAVKTSLTSLSSTPSGGN